MIWFWIGVVVGFLILPGLLILLLVIELIFRLVFGRGLIETIL